MFICTYRDMCRFTYNYVYVRVCVYLCMCLYIHIYVHIYICMTMCTCAGLPRFNIVYSKSDMGIAMDMCRKTRNFKAPHALTSRPMHFRKTVHSRPLLNACQPEASEPTKGLCMRGMKAPPVSRSRGQAGGWDRRSEVRGFSRFRRS